MLFFLLVYEIIPVPIFFFSFSFQIKPLVAKIKYLLLHTAQKMKFPITDFFSKCDQIRSFLFYLFIEEIRNGKLHFLCSVRVRHDISDQIYYNVNLMADVFKIIIKYCRKIIDEYRQISLFVMRCAIWYHFYNFKNVKNTHGGVLITN